MTMQRIFENLRKPAIALTVIDKKTNTVGERSISFGSFLIILAVIAVNVQGLIYFLYH